MASFCSFPAFPAQGLVVFWDPYTLVLTLNQTILLLAQTIPLRWSKMEITMQLQELTAVGQR
jgi:hypothetical protein